MRTEGFDSLSSYFLFVFIYFFRLCVLALQLTGVWNMLDMNDVEVEQDKTSTCSFSPTFTVLKVSVCIWTENKTEFNLNSVLYDQFTWRHWRSTNSIINLNQSNINRRGKKSNCHCFILICNVLFKWIFWELFLLICCIHLFYNI